MTTNEQGKKTRKKIYDFIVSYIKENEYPPTVREICDGIGIKSTSTVHTHMKKLQDAGGISTNECEPRTIRVLSELVEK